MLILSHSAFAETIGVSQAHAPDAFQSVIWKGVERESASSHIELTTSMAKSDAGLQASQIDALYAAGVDGVIASLSLSKQAATLVASARRARKPLVFVDAAPPEELLGSGVAFVGSNETEAGTLEMAEVCRLMKGKGTVAILMGELSHPAARARAMAAHEVLKSPACGSIELLEEQTAGWNRLQAHEIVRTWLRAGVKPDAIVAHNDEMALGAVTALKDAGTKDVIVAGIDATDDGLAAVQAGDLGFTVLQDARQQGEKAAAVAKAMIAGEAVPPKTMIPFKLITPDRAAQLVRERAGG